ncbi:MAG: hypothetical protein V4719_11030 [Planctomycetota bacterium]
MNASATGSSSSDATAVLRHWVYGLIIVTVVMVQLVRIASVTALYSPKAWPRRQPALSPMLSANDRSRWCTVWSLAERGTFQIDEIIRYPGWSTIDMVQQNGHFYSSKPPVLPVCVAGLYWVIKQIFRVDLLRNTHAVVQSILILVNLIPFAISLILLSRLVDRYAKQDLTRVFILAAAASATFLSTFLNTFNNHTVAANCILWSLCALLRVTAEGEKRWFWYSLAGFFGAMAVVNELPSAVFLALIGLILLRTDWKLTLLAFLPAALLPLVAHLVLTVIQTGGLKPFYASFGTELYNFRNSYWVNPQGVDKSLDTPWIYFFHCTVGHHGILSLSPILLVTLWSWIRGPGGGGSSERRTIYWLSLICTVVVLSFYMTRTAQYNYGGRTSGLRWMFWLTPLWLAAMIPVLDDFLSRLWFRRVCLVLLAVSVFSASFPWNNPWTHPWLFQVLEQSGWINYG